MLLRPAKLGGFRDRGFWGVTYTSDIRFDFNSLFILDMHLIKRYTWIIQLPEAI